MPIGRLPTELVLERETFIGVSILQVFGPWCEIFLALTQLQSVENSPFEENVNFRPIVFHRSKAFLLGFR